MFAWGKAYLCLETPDVTVEKGLTAAWQPFRPQNDYEVQIDKKTFTDRPELACLSKDALGQPQLCFLGLWGKMQVLTCESYPD